MLTESSVFSQNKQMKIQKSFLSYNSKEQTAKPRVGNILDGGPDLLKKSFTGHSTFEKFNFKTKKYIYYSKYVIK